MYAIRSYYAWIARKLGFTDEFNAVDKVIYTAQYVWIWMWGLVFVIGTGYHFARKASGNPIPDEAWIGWWKIHVGIFIGMATLVTLWYGIGGTINLAELYRTLKTRNNFV